MDMDGCKMCRSGQNSLMDMDGCKMCRSGQNSLMDMDGCKMCRSGQNSLMGDTGGHFVKSAQLVLLCVLLFFFRRAFRQERTIGAAMCFVFFVCSLAYASFGRVCLLCVLAV